MKKKSSKKMPMKPMMPGMPMMKEQDMMMSGKKRKSKKK